MRETVPTGQVTQLAAEVAPVVFKYVPAKQPLQAEEPAAEYLPIGHMVQLKSVFVTAK